MQFQPAEKRMWKHGLFDCCADANTCVIAYALPCIVYGRNREAFTRPNDCLIESLIYAVLRI